MGGGLSFGILTVMNIAITGGPQEADWDRDSSVQVYGECPSLLRDTGIVKQIHVDSSHGRSETVITLHDIPRQDEGLSIGLHDVAHPWINFAPS